MVVVAVEVSNFQRLHTLRRKPRHDETAEQVQLLVSAQQGLDARIVVNPLMDSLDALLQQLLFIALELFLFSIRQGELIKLDKERVDVWLLHLHEIETSQLLRDPIVFLCNVISLDLRVGDATLLKRRSVDADDDDFAVCTFIQNRQTIMQSAVYGELLHGTVRILTAAHQLNITVRCQLFKFALCAFSLNHHRDVSSCFVL